MATMKLKLIGQFRRKHLADGGFNYRVDAVNSDDDIVIISSCGT